MSVTDRVRSSTEVIGVEQFLALLADDAVMEYVRRARLKQSKSLIAFAGELDITPSLLRKYEYGETVPSATTMARIMLAIGTEQFTEAFLEGPDGDATLPSEEEARVILGTSGLSKETVRKMTTEADGPGKANEQLTREAALIVRASLYGATVLTRSGLEPWLKSENQHLGGDTPVQRIRKGGYWAVYNIVMADAYGTFL